MGWQLHGQGRRTRQKAADSAGRWGGWLVDGASLSHAMLSRRSSDALQFTGNGRGAHGTWQSGRHHVTRRLTAIRR